MFYRKINDCDKIFYDMTDTEYSHSILMGADDIDRMVKPHKDGVIDSEIIEWLDENCPSRWILLDNYYVFAFKDEIDAMAFLLRWS